MAAPARQSIPAIEATAGGPGPAHPIEELRSQHAALAESAFVIEEILVQGPLTDARLGELESRTRHLRFLLPRHLVDEEQALFPELLEANPASSAALHDLTGRHQAAEAAFVPLQAHLVELSVAPGSLGARRRAARAARNFRALLEALLAAEERGLFDRAPALLEGAPMARVSAALEGARARDALKAARHR